MIGAVIPGLCSIHASAICAGATPRSFREAKDRIVTDFERRFLVEALRRNGGNITRAAEEVGMYRQSFQQKMRELGIRLDDAGEG